MMHLVRWTGKRCPTYNPEQCIEIFTKIWADWKRHVEAAKGYKRIGTLNALDGKEDHLITREAKRYWDRLDMPSKRDRIIHDVDVEYEAGRLRWTPTDIKALIVPYPKTGHMDTIREFQDDEYPQLEKGENAADSEEELADHTDSDNDSADYDNNACAEGLECSLDKGTPASSFGEGTAEGLTYDQAKTAGELQAKLAVYEQARALMESIGDRSGAMAIARTIHTESRKARGRLQRDPCIAQALNDQLRAEFQEDARKRIEFAKTREAAQEAKQIKDEAKASKKQAAAAQAKLKEAQTFLECGEALKKFSPQMLGNELSRGGPARCRDLRFQVLDRLLAHGDTLSAQQKNDWQWFKKEWDAKMAAEHDKTWGSEFAGIVQHLLEELEKGNASAVADFMYNETARVLNEVPTLQL